MSLQIFPEIYSQSCYHEIYGTYLIQTMPTELRKKDLYIEIYLGYLYTLFMLVIPFSLLIAMNLAVIVSIQGTRKKHKLTVGSNSLEAKQEERKERSTTIMLIGEKRALEGWGFELGVGVGGWVETEFLSFLMEILGIFPGGFRILGFLKVTFFLTGFRKILIF